MKVHQRAMPSQCKVVSNKLRRLPHVFARVLELPLPSDADVLVEETSNSLRFTVAITNKYANITSEVQAEAINIFPGVAKIVIKGTGGADYSLLSKPELDLWRYRLPSSTRPEMARASCSGGKLVVTVPKSGDSENGIFEKRKAKAGEGEEEAGSWRGRNAREFSSVEPV